MSDLETRNGLPDALRVLARELPRDGWQTHRNFDGLTRFWMDRHLMFRDVLGRLRTGSEAYLDGKKGLDIHARETARYAGFLLNELHGHHQIEDAHYFPVMARLDKKVSAGFDLLDKDHHALDGILAGLTGGANAVLQENRGGAAFRDEVATFRGLLRDFDPMLNRHLIDEEELVVPVLLRYAPAQFR